MQEYLFKLENNKSRLYDWFAIFLFLLNLVIIARFVLQSPVFDAVQYTGLAASGCSIIAVLYFFLDKKGMHKKEFFVIAMLFIAAFWILTGRWWVAVLMLLLILLYIKSQRDMVIIINNDHISYPRFPVRIIEWKELNNVILKDKLLTIDFRNNRIIQHTVHETIGEQEFNEFCRAKLKDHQS